MNTGLYHVQQSTNKLVYEKTFNRIGFVPLDENVGYQSANYKMKVRVWLNGNNRLLLMAETWNTPVADGNVVASADAKLMVNGLQVAAQTLSLKRHYLSAYGGFKPIGEAYFQIPTKGSISINFHGGWTVYYYGGGAAVPKYNGILPNTININQRIVIR